MSGKYCITEKVAKNFSRWKNRIHEKESIFGSFGVLGIYSFTLFEKVPNFTGNKILKAGSYDKKNLGY